MKRVYRIFICLLVMSVTSELSFAQNIELPDVTTVIEGDSIKAGLDTLPNFTDVLVVEGDSGKIVPKLPDVDAPEETSSVDSNSAVAEKTIFAEGLIGGGYPTLFTGDFSVFRMSGESPFKLEFSYNSANGYAAKPLTDCFYDKNTKLLVEKSFTKNRLQMGAKGLYQSVNDGLQNQVPGISALNHEVYELSGDISYELGKGFSASAKLDLDFYNRFADVTSGDFPTVSYLNINPTIGILWEGYGANVGFDGIYLFGNDIENQLTEQNLHRAQFTLFGGWKNDFIRLYANGSAVIGNFIGENSAVVPFTVGVESGIPVSFSSRKITLSLDGGIQSTLPSLYKTEIQNKFSATTNHLQEQTDWYGKLAIIIPGGESFTGNLDFEYKQTAFGNQLSEVEYVTMSPYGAYDYVTKENQQANSKVGLSYHYKFLTFGFGWSSFWLNVPVAQLQNSVDLELNFQDDSAKWGATCEAKFGFGEEKVVPFINLEGYVRLTPAVRIVLSANDIVELMKNEQRVYAGNYITRSGNVSALLKFFF